MKITIYLLCPTVLRVDILELVQFVPYFCFKEVLPSVANFGCTGGQLKQLFSFSLPNTKLLRNV